MNLYRPGLLVLPEDDAFRQVANGFAAHHGIASSRIHVLAPAGGWQKVGSVFVRDEIPRLRKHERLRVLLLADFDGQGADGFERVFGNVPPDLCDRTFLLGPAQEAEQLKKELHESAFERVGGAFADGCPDDSNGLWDSPQLRHNKEELARLHASVAAFLLRVP